MTMDNRKGTGEALPPSDSVYTRAAEWLELLSEGRLDKMTARRFEDWLNQDTTHQAVLDRMIASWGDEALTEAAAQVAKQSAASANSRLPKSTVLFQRRIWWSCATTVTAGFLFAAVLLSGSLYPGQDGAPPVAIETQAAEVRRLNLADGSRLEMNAGSSISLQLDAQGRRVNLNRGAAFFAVAPDKRRPFQVHIDQVEVTAVGTEFNIDKSVSGIDITVYEGTVEVRAAQSVAPRLLQAGERVRVREGRMADIQQVDLSRIVDWRSGWIEIADEPLPYLLEQLSRYSRQPISAVDSELADVRVAGRFRIDDTDGTLALLSKLYPLQVKKQAGRILVQAAPH